MKLLANLRIKSERNAEFLLQAFFKASNPESSILIREGEVTMALELDGLSSEVIEEAVKAIGHCEIVRLSYGKTSEAVSDTEVEAAPETAKQVIEAKESQEAEEHSLWAEKLPQSTEQTQKTVEDSKSEDSKQPKKTKGKSSEKKEATSESTNSEREKLIQKLDEFAKDSNSYSLFLKKVISWFELDKNRSLFLINVLRVTEKVAKIQWNTIEAELSEIGVKMARYDVQKLKGMISKQTNLRVIEVIKILDGYKSKFSSLPESTAETQKKVEKPKPDKMPESSPEVSDTEEENAESKDVAEILKGSKLERRLIALDKRDSKSSWVSKILEHMEWSYLNSKDQYAVKSICEIALGLKNIAFENIFANARLQSFNQAEYVEIFSNFIDRYMKRNGINEKIDPIAFLKYFQNTILTDSEKRSL